MARGRTLGSPQRDWQRWARGGTTTQRGYGAEHQAERERRLQRYRPGDICPHCGQPLAYWPLAIARDYLDLPHNADRTGYLDGLAHRRCNRGDGARVGNARRSTARSWQSARRW
jgi:hypothetical protein